MMKNRILIFSLATNVILFLFCVVGVIAWKGSAESVYVVHKPAIVVEPPHAQEITPRQETLTPSLEAEREPLPSPPPRNEGFAPLLAELEELGLKIIPARLLQALDIRAINPDGSLSSEVLDLFTLGEEETQRLNRVLTETGSRLRELEMRDAYFVRLTDDQFRIRIPPLSSDASADLQEELRQGLRQELGDVDGSLLWDLMTGPHNSRFWSNFGGEGVDYTLTIEERENQNMLRIEKKPYGAEQVQFMTSMTAQPDGLGEFINYQLWRQAYLIDYLPEEAQRRIRAPGDIQPRYEP